jgi:hypothetical protein
MIVPMESYDSFDDPFAFELNRLLNSIEFDCLHMSMFIDQIKQLFHELTGRL